MATALREPDDRPVEDIPESTSLSFSPDSTGQTDIGTDSNPPVINRIVVRELGILPVQEGGPFAYVTRGRNYPYSQLATILGQLRAGTFVANGTVSRFNRPLDLNLSETTCFILYLKSLNDPDRNWRFSTDARAITLGDFTNYPSERDCYFNLMHVLADGTEQADHFPHGNECRIAYFFAKQPLRPTFRHPININVEMYFDDDLEGKNTIPLVIDPDVRYPGGSGVDGGPP